MLDGLVTTSRILNDKSLWIYIARPPWVEHWYGLVIKLYPSILNLALSVSLLSQVSCSKIASNWQPDCLRCSMYIFSSSILEFKLCILMLMHLNISFFLEMMSINDWSSWYGDIWSKSGSSSLSLSSRSKSHTDCKEFRATPPKAFNKSLVIESAILVR